MGLNGSGALTPFYGTVMQRQKSGNHTLLKISKDATASLILRQVEGIFISSDLPNIGISSPANFLRHFILPRVRPAAPRP